MATCGRQVGSVAVSLLALVALAAHAAPPAWADYGDPSKQGPAHPMTFPVIGHVDYTDTFGAPRPGGRTHQGQDLLGAKGQQLVAAVDGTLTWLPVPEPAYGWMIGLTGDDGWDYWYLHLNDDDPGTNDGTAPLSQTFAPGIKQGVHVKAGQLLGYMGDSGDAEGGAPHLHFELHQPDHTPVNSFAALNAAPHLDAPSGSSGQPPAQSPPSQIGRRFPRAAGEDREGTAVAASQAAWPNGSAAVVVASGAYFDEALPATVLAAQQHAPLLLAGDDGLTAGVRAEVRRLGATAATVIGSTPPGVDGDLQALGLHVTRIGTAGDPVGTSTAIARADGAAGGTAVLVNEDRFADAVSGAALAAGRGWPVLLSDAHVIPQPTVDTYRSLGVTRMFVIGGPDVLSERIRQFVPGGVRLAGDDRYGTSVAVTQQSLSAGGGALSATWVATGIDYPDALVAGAVAARTTGVVLLVDGQGGPQARDGATHGFLRANASTVKVRGLLGGAGAISANAEDLLFSDLNHSSG